MRHLTDLVRCLTTLRLFAPEAGCRRARSRERLRHLPYRVTDGTFRDGAPGARVLPEGWQDTHEDPQYLFLPGQVSAPRPSGQECEGARAEADRTEMPGLELAAGVGGERSAPGECRPHAGTADDGDDAGRFA